MTTVILNRGHMHVRLILGALLAIGLWSPRVAAACSCVKMAVEKSIEGHPVILSGRVTKMELSGPNMIRIEVTTEQAFRGTDGKNQAVVYSRPFAISCYGYNFRAGFRYLIFARTPDTAAELNDVPPGGQLVSNCGGTVELDTMEGSQRLKAVERVLRGR